MQILDLTANRLPLTPDTLTGKDADVIFPPDEVEAVTFSPNGSQLASRSFGGTVQVRNSMTGTLLQSFEGCKLSDLASLWSFPQSVDTPSLQQRFPFTLSASDRWIAVKGKHVLFLPHDYAISAGATQDNIIAFSRQTGQVIIMKFDI